MIIQTLTHCSVVSQFCFIGRFQVNFFHIYMGPTEQVSRKGRSVMTTPKQLLFTFGLKQAGLKWWNKDGSHWYFCTMNLFYPHLIQTIPVPSSFTKDLTVITGQRTANGNYMNCPGIIFFPVDVGAWRWVNLSGFKSKSQFASHDPPIGKSVGSNGMYSRIWM